MGAYASLPFQWVLGPSLEAIRAYSLFSTILIQVSLYLATRELFSARAAGIAVSLFSAFPLVIFYSRQSLTYDWLVLALALCAVYFGMRFLKGRSAWNLSAALSVVFVMLWAYLFTAWFALGVLAAAPLWAAALRGRAPIRLAWALCASAVGAVPLALQHIVSPEGSPTALVLRTVSGDSATLASDNFDLAHNLAVRGYHLFEILAKPHHGFHFANLDGWDRLDPTFPVLAAAGFGFALFWVAKKKENWRRMLGVLVLLSVMFVASTFTVSFLSIMQLGILVPFVFVLVGGSLDGIAARISRRRGLAAAACIVAAVVAVQAPVVADGYSHLAGQPYSQHARAAGALDAYLSERGLEPVEMDFWTRSLFFEMDGRHVPVKVRIGADNGTGFDPSSRGAALTAEELDLVRTDVAFVIYTYPEVLDCGSDMDASQIPLANQCLQAWFVESAAERNGLDVVATDFELPNGYPYYRALQMVPRT